MTDGAWAAALDRLEADTLAFERILHEREVRVDPTPWEVPALEGPLPEALRGRAERLLARQRAIQHALAELAGVNRRHAAYMPLPEPREAAYLDVDA